MGIDDSCGNDIFGGAVTVGIAALNPRLNMDYPLSGIDCVGALRTRRATSQSPLQLRDVNVVCFLMYFLRILLMYNMQCRGEWKLARGDSDPGMCVGAPCGCGGRPPGRPYSYAM